MKCSSIKKFCRIWHQNAQMIEHFWSFGARYRNFDELKLPLFEQDPEELTAVSLFKQKCRGCSAISIYLRVCVWHFERRRAAAFQECFKQLINLIHFLYTATSFVVATFVYSHSSVYVWRFVHCAYSFSYRKHSIAHSRTHSFIERQNKYGNNMVISTRCLQLDVTPMATGGS